MEYVKVILYELPVTVRGLTTYCYDDDGQAYYTIFINSKLSNDMQCEAYTHEIKHIDCGDFDSMVPVDELERIRHAG